MKAEITSSTPFGIHIGNKASKLLLGFKVLSEWEGLYLLVDDDGRRVVLDGDPSTAERRTVVRMSGGMGIADLIGEENLDGVWTHTHNETQARYRLLTVANSSATKEGWVETAIYTDGEAVWSRPLVEFKQRYTAI